MSVPVLAQDATGQNLDKQLEASASPINLTSLVAAADAEAADCAPAKCTDYEWDNKAHLCPCQGDKDCNWRFVCRGEIRAAVAEGAAKRCVVDDTADHPDPPNAVCTPCPPGRTGPRPAIGAAQACDACAAGRWSAAVGAAVASACAVCPAGFSTASCDGADDATAREACEAGGGEWLDGGDPSAGVVAALREKVYAECTQCGAGLSSLDEGRAAACEGAPAHAVAGNRDACEAAGGEWVEQNEASSACFECGVGKYSEEPGRTECTTCIPGTFQAGVRKFDVREEFENEEKCMAEGTCDAGKRCSGDGDCMGDGDVDGGGCTKHRWTGKGGVGSCGAKAVPTLPQQFWLFSTREKKTAAKTPLEFFSERFWPAQTRA